MKVYVKDGSNPITWYHGMAGRMFTVAYIKDGHYFKPDEEDPEGGSFGPSGVHCPDGELLYTTAEYTELKQARLMHQQDNKAYLLEQECHLNRIEVLEEGNKGLCNDLKRAYEEIYKQKRACEAEREARLLAEARLEIAESDHQPVVLPKEVAEALDTCKLVMSGIQIVSNLDVIGHLFRDYPVTVIDALWKIKHFAQQVIGGGQDLMSALVNGYTVDSPEDAAISEVADMLNKWTDEDYVNKGSIGEENREFAKEIIERVKAFSK